MKSQNQVLTAFGIAILGVAGFIGFIWQFAPAPGPQVEKSRGFEVCRESAAGKTAAYQETPKGLNPRNLPSLVSREPSKAQEKRPIEEELLEFGENPGAVFYMSRVREALSEGNPAFAKELYRQMKDQHANSVLIEEARILFEMGERSHEKH